jgi:hypothetical protein
MNLLQQGLSVQALQVKANAQDLTDADIKNIKAAGLRLVSRPDPVKTNVITLDDSRVMSAHTSPEAA